MPVKNDDNFVASAPPYVLIPYADYENVMKVALQASEINAKYDRLVAQYGRMLSMYQECIDMVGEIKKFVMD